MSETRQTTGRAPRWRRMIRMLLILLAVLVPVGAGVAYPYGQTLYSTQGIIHIVPVKQPILYATGGETIPMFAEFMKSESQRVRSQRVIDKALGDARWTQWQPNLPKDFGQTIASELQSSCDNELLYVTMPDRNPLVARLAVQTIVQAYNDIFVDAATSNERDIDSKLDNILEQTRSDVNSDQAAIIAVAKLNPYHTDDLDPVYKGVLKQLQELGDALQRKVVMGSLPTGEDLVQAIAQGGDKEMAEALVMRDDLRDRLAQDQANGMLPTNPNVVRATAELASANATIEKLKNDFLRRRDVEIAATATEPAKAGDANPAPGIAAPGNVQPFIIDPARADLRSLQAQYDARKQELAAIGKAKIQIVELKQKLSADEQKLREVRDRREQLAVERPMADRIEVWSDGSLPTKPSSDSHLAMAGIGAEGGAAASILIVMAFALAPLLSGASGESDNRKGEVL